MNTPETQRNTPPGREDRCCATCTTHLHNPLPVGATVTIERDEALWPPKGSWGGFAGRSGTIVTNKPEHLDLGAGFPPRRRRPAFHLEYGISWAKNARATVDHWFIPHEVTR